MQLATPTPNAVSQDGTSLYIMCTHRSFCFILRTETLVESMFQINSTTTTNDLDETLGKGKVFQNIQAETRIKKLLCFQVIQDMNTFKRLSKQAETDYYALYR